MVARSDKNKMDAKNLAIVFGSVIFGEDEMPKGGDLLSVQMIKVFIRVMGCSSVLIIMPGFLNGGLDITCAHSLRL